MTTLYEPTVPTIVYTDLYIAAFVFQHYDFLSSWAAVPNTVTLTPAWTLCFHGPLGYSRCGTPRS
jgi:hypothetical protein